MRTRVRSKRARPLADARSSPVAALELVASVCTIGMYAARPEEGVGVRGRQAVHMVVGHVCASARRASGVRCRSFQGVSRRYKAFPGLQGVSRRFQGFQGASRRFASRCGVHIAVCSG